MCYAWLRPLLFRLPPEVAHAWVLGALRLQAAVLGPGRPLQQPLQLMGLTFPNPVGIAAGLDKAGRCVDGLARLGVGFMEVGTVTPRPQSGNPRPRLFRLPQAQAIINRMGFNNPGAAALVTAIQKRRYQGVLGVSITKNNDTPLAQATQDYLAGLEAVYPWADYIAVNVSCPNVTHSAVQQQLDEMQRVLQALVARRDDLAQAQGRRVPLLVKLGPDVTDTELAAQAQLLLALKIDGVVAVNTTRARPASVAQLPHGAEAGGLSGAPLQARAVAVVRALRGYLGPDFPIIGVGGVTSGTQARALRQAGANLVQLYTGLVYRGPGLVREILGI